MAGEKPPGKEDFLPVPFTGACGRTRRRTIHVGCDCGHSTITEVYDSVNAQDVPTVVDRFLGGDLHDVVCPVCGRKQAVDVPVLFHDPWISVFVIAIPSAQRARELELREALLQRLIQGKAGVPDYVKRVEVVFTRQDLQKILATPPALLRAGARAEEERELAARRADLERREGEVLAREEDLFDREDKIVAANDKLRERRAALDGERGEMEREREGVRALSIDLTARERAMRERSKARRSPPALPTEVLGTTGKAPAAG
ncbi:MAG: hypothetical protein KAI47_10800, partial [Deltaproteobacteria bacterium]|nr:hypothetical protein [Deltaproteobacteria bacterium]